MFLFLYFIGNVFRNNINNTGAFEIFFNDQLLWSKLKNGKVPNLNTQSQRSFYLVQHCIK